MSYLAISSKLQSKDKKSVVQVKLSVWNSRTELFCTADELPGHKEKLPLDKAEHSGDGVFTPSTNESN